MSRDERIGQLQEALWRAHDARAMAQTGVWADAWQKFERELLEQMLECGPTDDAARYRLQIAIEASRTVRRIIEQEARTTGSLENELAVLKGEKMQRIA